MKQAEKHHSHLSRSSFDHCPISEMAESSTNIPTSKVSDVLRVLDAAPKHLSDPVEELVPSAPQRLIPEETNTISSSSNFKDNPETMREEFNMIDSSLDVPLVGLAINDENEDIKELGETEFVKVNTHDVTLVDEHIPDIERFAGDLQLAINAAWPTRRDGRYNIVYVLLISWEDDNLGVEREIRRLAYVFSNLYEFTVHEFRIPRKTPGRSTTSRITSLLESESQETLFIVYYAGHAGLGAQVNDPPIWAA